MIYTHGDQAGMVRIGEGLDPSINPDVEPPDYFTSLDWNERKRNFSYNFDWEDPATVVPFEQGMAYLFGESATQPLQIARPA